MKYSDETLSSISRAVQAVDHRPVTVGIDGQGGSGKSTFARKLAEVLPTTTWIVQGDDFYSDSSSDEKALLSPEEGYERFFDWRRMEREVLTSIRNSAPDLRYQKYNWDTEALGEWVEVLMPEVVIVEGVYTLRQEIREVFDVTVLLQADKATRVRRQISRGENSRYWIDRWMAAEDFYFEEKGPWGWVNYTVVTE